MRDPGLRNRPIVHRVNLQMKDAREIGSYELIERIGAGGMGEVWRARHRLLACPAAIKLIRSSMLGENQRGREGLARRFEREARETAALGSIHTIEVYDFGVTEEGDFYYVMELLEGISVERNTVCGKVRRSTLVSVIVTSAGSS